MLPKLYHRSTYFFNDNFINSMETGCTPQSRMEIPFPPDTVPPFAVDYHSRPVPVFGLGIGDFQPVFSGKYPFCNDFSRSDCSSDFSNFHSSPASAAFSAPGRIEQSILEASDPPDSVQPIAVHHHRSRPGPVVGAGDEVFQPTPIGKYISDNDLLCSDVPSHSSASANLQHIATVSGNIWIYYQNVRGLRTKIDDLFLATFDCNYDVIILTETGLNSSINSVQLFGNHFNVFRCDRNVRNSRFRRFGGVLIAVAARHASAVIELLNFHNLEQICVSTVIGGKKLLLCAVYIPPDKSHDVDIMNGHLSAARELCDKASGDDSVFVCGDFNQPHILWEDRNDDDDLGFNSLSVLSPASTALVDGMVFLNLRQENFHRNHLGRILDLMFCAIEHDISVHESIVPLLPIDPHHPPLEVSVPFTMNDSSSSHNDVHDERAPLNYRKINFDALLLYLEGLNWGELFRMMDVNEMAAVFCNRIRDWLSANLPVCRRPASPAWSTPGLRKLKRHRNACLRKHRHRRTPVTKQQFKLSSTAYRRLNSTLYKSYVLNVETNLRRNPKSFWAFVNSKRKTTAIPSNVFLGDDESTSLQESCDLFGCHFASVFAEGSATDFEADVAASAVPADLVDLNTFEVSTHMVIAAVKKLKNSFSPGPDGIPAAIYCRCVTALAEPLTRIFNRSFEQGMFPEIWKQSFMFPVFKKGERRNVTNYRGITNLSAASKIFEIIVSGVIQRKVKNYISFDQHGFTPGRSVTTNLLEFTSHCIQHMEQKAQVDAIYTDLKAAFDLIDHRVLLRKLSRLGASDQLVVWLSSYLSGRSIRVKLGSCISPTFSNNSGVPQGSNLGPLLFAIFFNDVALLLDAGCKLVYADDLKLYLVVRSIEDCRRLQTQLDIFANWCRRNKLIVSISKCMVITYHRFREPILFDYKIDDIVLLRVDQINDLGVVLDSKLTFNRHRTEVITKANRQLGFITKVCKSFSDPYCLKALYCSLVRPILESASLIWFPHQITWLNRLERVQKRFLRIALRNLPWRDPLNLPPYPERCRLLSLETLDRRFKLQQATFVAKLLNGEVDSPMLLSLLDFRAPQRPSRHRNLLQPRFHRTAFGYHESIAAMIRVFTTVEVLFEFGERSSQFRNRLSSSNLI